MYNQVITVWTSSNLTTKKTIDFTNHNSLCFDLIYYIPNQTNTGQGIYYGVLYGNYNNAFSGSYLSQTTNQTEELVCVNISNINEKVYPFIEIYNGHTMTPYDGWVANTYFYLRRVYLR